jgi:mono/diheme cytochrome c family protein
VSASCHPERSARRARSEGSLGRIAILLPVLFLSACSWFTDFKQQPKIDPWETPSDTIPFRGNPQMSVPTTGSAAPGFLYDRIASPQSVAAMSGIQNPVPADSSSVNRGRIQYQINCAVCHGPSGAGMGVVSKYGLYPPPIGTPQAPAAGYPDGLIFGVIRNGKGTMPPYNRIEEPDRWDIINYMRSLQGKIAFAADTSHCRPGETGLCVPGASQHGPTRPSAYFRPSLTAPSGEARAAPAAPGVAVPPGATTPSDSAAKKTTPDSTKKPEHRP